MEIFISFAVGVIILILVTMLLKLSSGLIIKLLLNALIGGAVIFFLSLIGINIELTLFNAIFIGIFGLFGVLILLIF